MREKRRSREENPNHNDVDMLKINDPYFDVVDISTGIAMLLSTVLVHGLYRPLFIAQHAREAGLTVLLLILLAKVVQQKLNIFSSLLQLNYPTSGLVETLFLQIRHRILPSSSASSTISSVSFSVLS